MKKLLLAGIVILICNQLLQAQKVVRLQSGEKGMQPSLIEFSSTDAPSFKKGNVILVNTDNFRSSVSSNAVSLQNDKDELGFEHHRYQQVINGIPVENSFYILHVKEGRILSENGRWIKDIPLNISHTASIKEIDALKNDCDI